MTTYKRGANSHSLFPIKQQKQMVIWLQQQQQQLSAEKLAKRRESRSRSEEDKVKLKSQREIRRGKLGAFLSFTFSVFLLRDLKKGKAGDGNGDKRQKIKHLVCSAAVAAVFSVILVLFPFFRFFVCVNTDSHVTVKLSAAAAVMMMMV